MAIRRINPKGETSRRVGRMLVGAIEHHLVRQRGDLAGFAVVVWDGRGYGESTIVSKNGPIGRTRVPMFVHDVLLTHVAVLEAAESSVEPVRDPTA